MFGLTAYAQKIIAGILTVLLLIVVVLTLGFCQARKEARTAKSEGRVAVATGKALDKVSTETETIRNDQKEKEKAVDEIQGSDQRLPAGYGAELQRLRVRDRDKHRNP